jgi:hypothetical protein
MLVEGQSEEIFVRRSLALHLERYEVYVVPIVLRTKFLPSDGGFRGGVSNWNQILRNLRLLMRDGDAWITTLLDFYGLPKDFPGLPEALCAGDPYKRVTALQQRFAAELNHPRFIPFLALHEFETWLFSEPDVVAAHFGQVQLADELRAVIQETGGPERMNHGATTHPKARLRSLVSSYKETSDGPTLLEKIGIAAVRAACPHFDDWLHRLETLAET